MLGAIGPHLISQIISGGTAFLYGTVCSRPYNQIAERSIACMFNDHVLQVSLHQATLVLFNAWFYSHITAVTVSPALVVGAALIPLVWGAIYSGSRAVGFQPMDVATWRGGMDLVQRVSMVTAIVGAVLIGLQGHVIFGSTFGAMLLLGQLKRTYTISRSLGNTISGIEFSTAVLGALLIGAWYDRLRAAADVGLRTWDYAIGRLQTVPIIPGNPPGREQQELRPDQVERLTADNLAFVGSHLRVPSIYPPEGYPPEFKDEQGRLIGATVYGLQNPMPEVLPPGHSEGWADQYRRLALEYFKNEYLPQIYDGLKETDDHFRWTNYLTEIIVQPGFTGGVETEYPEANLKGRLLDGKLYVEVKADNSGWVRSLNVGDDGAEPRLGILNSDPILTYVQEKFEAWISSLSDLKRTEFGDVRRYALWCLSLLKNHENRPADGIVNLAGQSLKKRRQEEIAYYLAGLGWNLRRDMGACEQGYVDVALTVYGQLAHAGFKPIDQRIAASLVERRRKILDEFLNKLTAGQPIDNQPGIFGWIDRLVASWSAQFINPSERHLRNLVLQVLRQRGLHIGLPEEDEASRDFFYRMSLTELAVWWNIPRLEQYFNENYSVGQLDTIVQGEIARPAGEVDAGDRRSPVEPTYPFFGELKSDLERWVYVPVAEATDGADLNRSIAPETRSVTTFDDRRITEKYLWALLVRHGVLKVIDPSRLQRAVDVSPRAENALA